MKEIKFNVKFITPLLIGGVERDSIDKIGLTGKALRGCWRFWFRALAGGMIPNISKDKLLELEGKIFGSSDEKVGAKFRMIITPECLTEIQQIYIGFTYTDRRGNTRKTLKKGFREESIFAIKILRRLNNMSDYEQKILLASIWLWANLGGIGQRARRGFGSPIIEAVGNSDPFRVYNLCATPEFKDSTAIENHLRAGLLKVWEIFKETYATQLTSKGYTFNSDIATTPGPTNEAYRNARFFTLSSLKQVAVGEKSYDLNQAIEKIHGDSKCNAMGSFNPRMASPVFTRLHKVNNGFVPVVTWSKQNDESITCVKTYLRGADINKWLNGTKIS